MAKDHQYPFLIDKLPELVEQMGLLNKNLEKILEEEEEEEEEEKEDNSYTVLKVVLVFKGAALMENFPKELTRILNTIPRKVEHQLKREPTLCTAPETDDLLFDINGNQVGTLIVMPAK